MATQWFNETFGGSGDLNTSTNATWVRNAGVSTSGANITQSGGLGQQHSVAGWSYYDVTSPTPLGRDQIAVGSIGGTFPQAFNGASAVLLLYIRYLDGNNYVRFYINQLDAKNNPNLQTIIAQVVVAGSTVHSYSLNVALAASTFKLSAVGSSFSFEYPTGTTRTTYTGTLPAGTGCRIGLGSDTAAWDDWDSLQMFADVSASQSLPLPRRFRNSGLVLGGHPRRGR